MWRLVQAFRINANISIGVVCSAFVDDEGWVRVCVMTGSHPVGARDVEVLATANSVVGVKDVVTFE